MQVPPGGLCLAELRLEHFHPTLPLISAAKRACQLERQGEAESDRPFPTNGLPIIKIAFSRHLRVFFNCNRICRCG